MIAVDREEERKEIIRRYRKLLRKAKPFLKDDDAAHKEGIQHFGRSA
mgnify:CR=1 FL=1